MLRLRRKFNERIIIGDNITIVVCDIRQGEVQLGIEAPPDVSVDRMEVHLSKTKDGEKAA